MSHTRLGVTVLVLVLAAGGAFAASQSEAMADEPITIVAMEGTADYVPDTPVELALEELLGVKLEALPLHVHEEEKIIATFSGGDVPDMFTRYTASLLIDNGFTRQISEEMIREHMPNYSAIVDEFGGESAWRKWRDAETGMLNAVPVITMGSTTRFSMGVRSDWLAKLGLEVPATIDDFGQMLAAFVHLDPDGNGKDDTHGLTGQPGWPTVLQWPTIFGAYGVLPGGSCFPGCGRWIDEGGEVVWSDASAGYRQALEALAEAYAAGLIDPEWATQTEEAAGAKVAEGLVGAWDWHTGAFMAGSSGAPARAMQKNPDATWEVIWDGLTGPDGHHGTFAFSETPVSGWARMIGNHVDDAKLAKILQINEMLWTDIDVFTLSYCGIEGETYTIAEDGRCEFLVEKAGCARHDHLCRWSGVPDLGPHPAGLRSGGHGQWLDVHARASYAQRGRPERPGRRGGGVRLRLRQGGDRPHRPGVLLQGHPRRRRYRFHLGRVRAEHDGQRSGHHHDAGERQGPHRDQPVAPSHSGPGEREPVPPAPALASISRIRRSRGLWPNPRTASSTTRTIPTCSSSPPSR